MLIDGRAITNTVIGRTTVISLCMQCACGYANHCTTGLNIMYDNRICTDTRTFADFNIAQYLRPGSDNRAILDIRMTLRAELACIHPAQCDIVKDGDIIADLRCLADHNADPMINEHAAADLCAGMYLDACQYTGNIS